jgi:hypothetical protein
MSFRGWRIVAVSAACCCLGLVGSVPTASARSRPSAAIAFANGRLSAGQPLKVFFSTAHLPRRASVYLQRQFGTQKVFKNIMKLKGAKGAVTTSGLQMGRYGYRVIVKLGKRTVTTSSVDQAFFYGLVTAAQLCNTDENDIDFTNGCNSNASVQVGTSVFDYVSTASGENTNYDGGANVTATGSSCRSATITFAMANGAPDPEASVALTQSSADLQSASAANGMVGTLSASISSGSWDLIFWTTTGNSEIYWNGTFQCWTPTGEA